MIGRKNTPVEEPEVEPRPGGKGRPTPKRREAEARNKRPLVPNDRKEAKRIARERRNELWQKQRQAMITGDERYLPLRDKGRPRRYARDYVDARWCIAELFMPIALLLIIAMMFVGTYRGLANVIVIGTYGMLLVSIIDGLLMVQLLKRRLRKTFDEDEIPRWTGLYAFTRAFYFRRMRQPKPQVKRGEFPT
ncbi:DUF3043 domain-containing protein [Georgenia alba]|uniref:DUF3043 domain-containing protein n=1 Tax=Georgenia alba TaxID=2233858 RepID=A0ABW2QFR9_9MICO